MKWINAERQVTVTIYDEKHEEHIGKTMTVEEMLDTYTNEGCPTIYINPERQTGEWIPCSERLPENRVSVIVCYREWQQYAKRYAYTIVIGWYARKHSVKENVFSEWEDECDYNEEDDEYYIQEGWYEFTTQGNSDLFSWYIGGAEVIAWMPLPEVYQEGEQDEPDKQTD